MTLAAGDAPNLRPEERDYRHNLVVLGADFSLFMLALGFASPQTLIPAFAERLGASNLVIGAIPALMQMGWLLPAVFAANHTQSLSRKLPFILRYTALERLPYLGLAIAAIWLAPTHPGLTLVASALLLLVMTTVGGMLIPAWLDMVAKLVPTQVRGRFFATGNAIGTALGLLGAAAVSWILDRYGSPVGYGICFLVGFGWMAISFVFLLLVREPPGPVQPRPLPAISYLRRLGVLVRTDANLSRFLIGRALVVSGGMATGFYTVRALRELGAADVQVGVFTALTLASQTLAMLAFGWLADRRGHLFVLTIGAVASGGASLAALAATDIVSLYLAFVFLGLSIGANNVSSMTIALELGPEHERPTYVAINNSSAAPFLLASPLLAGLIADAYGFAPVFALAAALSGLGAFCLALLVRDPRQMPPAQAA